MEQGGPKSSINGNCCSVLEQEELSQDDSESTEEDLPTPTENSKTQSKKKVKRKMGTRTPYSNKKN
jgi:hypothetical protein